MFLAFIQYALEKALCMLQQSTVFFNTIRSCVTARKAIIYYNKTTKLNEMAIMEAEINGPN